ncbi:B-cell antigen receptor complex-associated protein alpha chain [Brachyhypopomus gauderio]|uniref:B-cell antigen receptor complex-associated protein alpha chain n=1 Tax=Brachyhypopomus gauderio TaxID=698409 RepID=UPI00404309D0
MEIGMVLLVFLAAPAEAVSMTVQLQADKTSIRVPVFHDATMDCCYSCNATLSVTWMVIIMVSHSLNNTSPNILSDKRMEVVGGPKKGKDVSCMRLNLRNVTVNDTGLYQCRLNHTDLRGTLLTPGTYLQVFKPFRKTLNISERAKNSVITAEGVLLLLCVLLPGASLLCKTKSLNELQKKKGKEEENIYEGLNLDDCNSTYHQIQRSLMQGPYQDVGTMRGDIQLEKP